MPPAQDLNIIFESQGKPLIALFHTISKRQRTIVFDASGQTRTSSAAAFAVGDMVSMRRRNAANQLLAGILGEVLGVEVKAAGGTVAAFYAVRCFTSRRVELGVPENLLEYSPLVVGGIGRCQPENTEPSAEGGPESEATGELRRENDYLRKYIRELKAEAAAKAVDEAKAADKHRSEIDYLEYCIRDLKTEAKAGVDAEIKASNELRREIDSLKSCIKELKAAKARSQSDWNQVRADYLAVQKANAGMKKRLEGLTGIKAAHALGPERMLCIYYRCEEDSALDTKDAKGGCSSKLKRPSACSTQEIDK